MLKFIYVFLTSLGFTGWQLDTVTSLIFVVCFLTVIPVIGSIVRKFAEFQIRILSKLVGSKFAEFICNRLLFLGTVTHELSHALFAVLSGAKIVKIRCLTLFSKDTLGYVSFITMGKPVKKSFQLAFIGCAPTVMGCIILWQLISRWQFFAVNFPVQLFLIYFGISVVDHMSMSLSDVHNYKKGCLLLFLLLFILSMGFCHFCMA